MKTPHSSKVRTALFACLITFHSTGCAAVRPERLEHYVVVRTEAVKTLPKNETGNLLPWTERDPKPDEIVISNSCGFAEYSYSAFRLNEYPGYFNIYSNGDSPPVIKAKGHLDEWCRLQPYLFETPTLVTIAYWKGAAYVYRHADIHWDWGDDDNEYVDDDWLIVENGWADKLSQIREPTNSSNCIDVASAPDGRLEWFLARPNVKKVGDKYCYSKGVYIRDLSNVLGEPSVIQ